MDFKTLTIREKPIFDNYFKKLGYENSESNFTTLFSWRLGYHFKYHIEDNFLFVKGKSKGIDYAMLPVGTGNMKQAVSLLLENFVSENKPFSIKPLTREMAASLDKACPGQFCFKEMRPTYDYIYRTEDLITLQGKKYHAKRNHLNRFMDLYEYYSEEISQKNIQEIKSLLNDWIAVNDERDALNAILDNYAALKLNGMLLRIDGRIAAVTIGEMLTKDMALIHVEKADKDIRGAYTAINQLFLQEYFSQTTFVNREEDMGIEGLRKAKLSYHPCKLLEKYCAVLRG